jgi:hypothetical protein
MSFIPNLPETACTLGFYAIVNTKNLESRAVSRSGRLVGKPYFGITSRLPVILPESAANANEWLDHSVEAPLRGARRKQGSILLTHIDIE